LTSTTDDICRIGKKTGLQFGSPTRENTEPGEIKHEIGPEDSCRSVSIVDGQRHGSFCLEETVKPERKTSKKTKLKIRIGKKTGLQFGSATRENTEPCEIKHEIGSEDSCRPGTIVDGQRYGISCLEETVKPERKTSKKTKLKGNSTREKRIKKQESKTSDVVSEYDAVEPAHPILVDQTRPNAELTSTTERKRDFNLGLLLERILNLVKSL